jgi:hypothetical protein
MVMSATREELVSVGLGSTKEIGSRLVADGLVIDRLAALGDKGMASGVAEAFDIDAFVADVRAGR